MTPEVCSSCPGYGCFVFSKEVLRRRLYFSHFCQLVSFIFGVTCYISTDGCSWLFFKIKQLSNSDDE